MNNASKVRSKYKLAYSVVFVFCLLTVQSKDKLNLYRLFHNSLTASQDTTIPRLKRFSLPATTSRINTDTFPPKNKYAGDTTIFEETKDTIDLKISKDTLDARLNIALMIL